MYDIHFLNDELQIYHHSPHIVVIESQLYNSRSILKDEYLSMVNQYSHILFQSPTQAKTLKDLAGWSEGKTLVLRPSASMEDIN